MKKPNWKKITKCCGAKVLVYLKDHAIGSEIIPCKTIGWLIAVNEDDIKICYWDLVNTKDESREYNYELISIVKDAIVAIYPLTVGKWKS